MSGSMLRGRMGITELGGVGCERRRLDFNVSGR